MKNKSLSVRWLYLVLGVASMLFAGIIYGWSILKSPLATEFGWNSAQLTLNFTITMIFFCLGGFVGAKLTGKLGVKLTAIIAGILAALGFIIASAIDGSNILFLYLSYGLLAGLGIGIAYNVVIGTVNAWFPDKKGLCSGALMMGFGSSSLVLGNIANAAMESFGWRTTYAALGIGLGLILIITGLILQRPQDTVVLPCAKSSNVSVGESFQPRDYSTKEMLCRKGFWVAFIAIGLLAGVGSCVISFAKDLALSVGATAGVATTLVGILSVCNGLGRIMIGALFDTAGRKVTMVSTAIIAILASLTCLLAVFYGSLGLCIAGLCLVGLSYGGCPTCSSTFTSAFYGSKHFATNFSVMNINLILSALISTACGNLQLSCGSYTVPFAVLAVLSTAALGMILTVKKP